MLNKVLFVLVVLLQGVVVLGQDLLSPAARVSVITCAPGHEMYSAYGHTAIRIQDQAKGLDVCFNYGVFDSFEDNFALKFAGGRLDYQIGADDYADFYAAYAYYGRGLQEQVLQLSPADNQAVYSFLQHNYKPENREYRYHFFYDNCSTRVRDVLEQVLGDRLQWPEAGSTSVVPGTTFREVIHQYQSVIPWTNLGIDVVLGLPCDKEISPREEAFLPDFLLEILDGATLDGKALVAKEHPLLMHRLGPAELGPSPTALLWVVAGLLMIWIGVRTLTGKRIGFSVRLLCFVFGLVGLLLLVMWFLTDHDTTTQNFNLLWANPLLLGALVPKWRKPLMKVVMVMVLVFLVLFPLLPQGFHYGFVPLGLLVLLTASAVLVSKKSLGEALST